MAKKSKILIVDDATLLNFSEKDFKLKATKQQKHTTVKKGFKRSLNSILT